MKAIEELSRQIEPLAKWKRDNDSVSFITISAKQRAIIERADKTDAGMCGFRQSPLMYQEFVLREAVAPITVRREYAKRGGE